MQLANVVESPLAFFRAYLAVRLGTFAFNAAGSTRNCADPKRIASVLRPIVHTLSDGDADERAERPAYESQLDHSWERAWLSDEEIEWPSEPGFAKIQWTTE